MTSFRDFEKIAELLEEKSRTLPQSQREVALRRAISTIYYGVFWEVRERLRQRGYKIRESQPHSTILGILAEHFPKIYSLVKELKKWRELADYDSNWQVERRKYLQTKYLAKLILEGV